MTKNAYLIFLVILSYSVGGCSMGLRWGQMGRYFKSSMPDSAAVVKTENIAVCAFSNGAEIPVLSVGSDIGTTIDVGLILLTRIIPGSWLFPPPEYESKGLRYQLFPDEIKPFMEMYSDSSTKELSMHIMEAVCDSLRRRGYFANPLAYNPSSDTIRMEEVLSQAKKSGVDAVFVVYYSVVTGWLRVTGYQHVEIPERTYYDNHGISHTVPRQSYNVEVLGIENQHAVLPNAALIRVSDNTILWSTSYYGLVKNASIPNMSHEALNFVVSKPVLQYSENRVLKAGTNAMEIIFNPPKWRGSYIPLPTKR